MSNTKIRIISGIVLIFLVFGCLYVGPKASLVLIGMIGVFVIDELIVNFYHQRRFSKRYLLSQILYSLGYYFFNFYQISKSSFNFWNSAGIFLNILLMTYLFLIMKKSDLLLKVFRATSWMTGFIILIPLLSLSSIIHFKDWQLFIRHFHFFS